MVWNVGGGRNGVPQADPIGLKPETPTPLPTAEIQTPSFKRPKQKRRFYLTNLGTPSVGSVPR